MLGNISFFLLSSADFFQKYSFKKILSGTLSECQTVWIQIRTDILSVLIWVQNVCEGYQQTTKIATSMERVKTIEIKEIKYHIWPNYLRNEIDFWKDRGIMNSWVSCNVSEARRVHVNFARDPKYSWFHEPSKNWIYCLYLHFIFNI